MAMKSDLTLQDNTLYHGDCLGIMEAWVKTYPGGCVDLIYLDPPFNSNANYNILYGKDQKGKPRDEQAQFIAFNDTWYWGSEAAERVKNIGNAVAHPAYKAMRGLLEMLPEGGMLAYLSYMAERLAVMRDLLKENGSIYLHCDPTASHYLKAVMDCIFGAGNFRNELVWGYRGMGNRQAAKFQSRHDVILFYVKGKPTFNFQYGDPTPGSIKTYESAERVGYLANHRRKLVTVFDWDKYRAAVESGKLPKGMKEKEFDGGKPLIADWWEDIKILGGPNNKEPTRLPDAKTVGVTGTNRRRIIKRRRFGFGSILRLRNHRRSGVETRAQIYRHRHLAVCDNPRLSRPIKKRRRCLHQRIADRPAKCARFGWRPKTAHSFSNTGRLVYWKATHPTTNKPATAESMVADGC